ncbi:MAG: adenylate kinase [Pseudomonadota bacterium]
MRLVLVGAPGSGKGTQGEKLVAHFKIPKISTGDLLRAAVAAGTSLGKKAKAAMDAGELVADDIVIGMAAERLAAPDTKNGFIFDGFPRSIAQAEALDTLLGKSQQPLQKVVHLDVPNEEIVKRMMARGRADDNETVIRNRLSVYSAQTQPLLEYYGKQGKRVTVKGDGSLEEIFNRILSTLK